MSKGTVLEEVEIPLEANGQEARFIDQAFPGTDTSDFAGAVRCDAVGEGLFSAVALEMDPGTRTFTTLPVFPVPEMPPQESTPARSTQPTGGGGVPVLSEACGRIRHAA